MIQLPILTSKTFFCVKNFQIISHYVTACTTFQLSSQFANFSVVLCKDHDQIFRAPTGRDVEVFPLRIYLGKSWNRFSRTADKVRGTRKPKNGIRARDTVSLRKHNNYRGLHLIMATTNGEYKARKPRPLQTRTSWSENCEEIEVPGTPKTPRTSTTPGR